MFASEHRPVIFVCFANDHNDRTRYLRDLAQEEKQLTEILDKAQQDGLCKLIVRARVTAEELFRVFQSRENRNNIAVFHFAGHANGYQLFLETIEGNVQVADAAGLAAFLGQQRALQLVFLNGCSTAPQVQGLLDANVSAVLATSQAIADEVATEFATHFYASLAGGASMDAAYHDAKAAIATTRGATLRKGHSSDVSKDSDLWPWQLHVRDGAEIVLQWNLPDEADNPLFGLPPLPSVQLPMSPYPHLRWYEREHAEVFFGRGYQIREIYNCISSIGTSPIILLYGQSGVGKSSLLEAGLLPRLNGIHTVWYLRRDQTQGLLNTLQRRLVVGNDYGSLQQSWLEQERKTAKPLTVILDQIEEIWTRPNRDRPGEMEEFCDTLETIINDKSARPAGKIVLCFRKEWLLEVEEPLKHRKLRHTRIPLDRLDRRAIVEAVVGVMRSERLKNHYGLAIEEGLPETIAETLLADPESPIAPTLQILLAEMWERAIEANQEHPFFSKALYIKLKQEGLLLGDFLDQQLARLEKTQPETSQSGLALDLLAFHTTGRGTAEERTSPETHQAYHHREDVLPELIQFLKDTYLLVDAGEHHAPTTENHGGTRLAHDTLAPLVRERFRGSVRPGQRARRILEARAGESSGVKKGIPLNAADLQTIEQGRSGMRAWTNDELRLIESSRLARKNRRFRLSLQIGSAVTLAVFAAVLAWLNEKELVWDHVPSIILASLDLYNIIEPQVIELPRGKFLMGSRENDDKANQHEKPRHKVEISKPFAMGKYEITVDEYLNFALATGRRLPLGVDEAALGLARRPVTNVTWNDAVDYASWLSRKTGKKYRLPTEAEWEYAARAGTNYSRFWGDDPDEACQYANVADNRYDRIFNDRRHSCDDSYPSIAPTGAFYPNPFDLHDMLGNVWEWVSDCWHDNYEGAPSDGSNWDSDTGECKRRVARGGSYVNGVSKIRVTYRGKFKVKEAREIYLGFRIARD